jgi:predicted Zn finger-like uncharacterized protein
MADIIRCPSCGRQLRVQPELRGRLVKCPSCGTTFTAAGEGDTPRPAPPARAPRPDEDADRVSSSRRRPTRPLEGREDEANDRYEDDDDDYDARPRRRRPRRREGAARAAVSGPAIALMITGGLALGFSILGMVLNLTVGGLELGGAAPPGGQHVDEAEAAGRMVGAVLGGIIGICWGGIVLAGALKMKNLESYGLAMAAAIIAMLPCNGCCILGLPFGIWALIAMNNPDVRDAFR